MRLSRDDLFKITRLRRPTSQAAWFLQHLGVDVPCDNDGPILTPTTYEAILAKRLGVFPKSDDPAKARETVIHVQTARPAKQKLASVTTIKEKA